MKILVVSNMYPGRRRLDFGIFVADRIEAYRRRGVQVDVVANTDPRKGVVLLGKYAWLLARAAVRSLIERPAVVECHYVLPTGLVGLVAARLGGAALVLYAHGSDVLIPGRFWWLVRWLIGTADEVHTNSAHTAEAVRALGGEEKTKVIPPGVDLDLFSPGPEVPGRVIGFVGSLVPNKGADVLLSALSRLAESPWRAEIVGDGPELATLETAATSLGIAERVAFPGALARNDLPGFYRRLAVLVVPSRREAFGQVAVEALACGTPVVVSAAGGLASIPTSECGTVVPVEDADALAGAISSWLDQPDRRVVVAAARERARDFGLDAMADEALARFKSLSGLA